MVRETIDYGIDLGTTNSSIAVIKGIETDVIPNTFGSQITPSAVYIDKKGRFHIGQAAKEWVVSDPDNAKGEFKLLMGQGEGGKKLFVRSGKAMLPEELSAEVLKSLRADVREKKGEDIEAVVITVPAAFKVDECDATKKAAELAGFGHCPLLQEPVAAALAYGFQASSDNVFWMVYDFGGGTFDAAIIQVRDGFVNVVNHAGDRYLGGQRIDWDIVEKRFIPKLTSQFRLKDFGRGNPNWRFAMAKLKGAAEEAKIEACRKKGPASVWVEDLCKDDTGKVIDFEYELKPEELEQIVSPYITESLRLCREAMKEKGLSTTNIEKILMVGGTSLIPWLRDKVKKELGIDLESSIDPMTVVARGAAIFAGKQMIDPNRIKWEIPAGAFELKAVCERISSDTEPPVSGKVIHPAGGSMKGYTIEFVEARSQWRSGKIGLGEDGGFETQLCAEKGRENEFLVELCDHKGIAHKVVPDRLKYTIGIVADSIPLTHNVGVALANNEPFIFFKKGEALPARRKEYFHAARTIRKGQRGEFMKIPAIEGEDTRRADRNDIVGSLDIEATNIKRDVPAGSDIEVTIRMDESRNLTVKAFIPILDEEFEEVIKYEKERQSVSQLQEAFEKEKKRLQDLRGKAAQVNSLKAQEALARIESEDMLSNIQSLLDAAKGDTGAIPQFQEKLVALRRAIDAVEDAIEWPTLVNEARVFLEEAKRVISRWGNQDEKSMLNILEQDIQKAIDSGDPDMLRKYLDETRSLYLGALQRQDGFWVGLFEDLEKEFEKRKHSMQDKDIQQAEHLIAQGRKAINNGDIEGLKAVDRQLAGLLYQEDPNNCPIKSILRH